MMLYSVAQGKSVKCFWLRKVALGPNKLVSCEGIKSADGSLVSLQLNLLF